MIIKIDEFLIRLAKKIIMAASFFGISRKQVLIGWVVLSAVLFVMPINEPIFPASLWICMLCGYAGARFIYLPVILSTYRDDDIMADDLLLRERMRRLFALGLWSIAAYASSIPPSQNSVSIQYWLIIAKFVNIYFWPYFCLNQNHKCKMTAKDWLTAIKKALQPKPGAQPVPQSVSTSFQARN